MISLIFIVIMAAKKAFAILAQLELNGEAINLKSISNAAVEASNVNGSFMTMLPWILIIFCWIFGTLDAYRIGKKQENE